MRMLSWLVLLSIAGVVVAGCGGGAGTEATQSHREKPDSRVAKVAGESSGHPGEPTELSVTLAGREGPEDAGIAMAYTHGYFEVPSISVGVAAPLTPTRPIRYVVEGTDQIGVAHLPQVALAREKGLPVVAIGSVLSGPTATMIWLKSSGIHAVSDLKGKRIAIPGLPFQRNLLEGILAHAGLAPGNVKIVKAGNNLASKLRTGRVDALFGGYGYVEGKVLEARGLEPVVTPVTGFGVPPYEELVWITRSDLAAAQPAAMRAFLRAMRRGTAMALARPLAAAETLDQSGEKYLGLGPAGMAAGVREALPVLSRSGRMSLAKANRLFAWMYRQGLIERRLPASELLTNRYLPRAAGS